MICQRLREARGQGTENLLLTQWDFMALSTCRGTPYCWELLGGSALGSVAPKGPQVKERSKQAWEAVWAGWPCRGH